MANKGDVFLKKLFGTDGVRGIANTELTGDLAYNLGRAGAYVLTKEFDHIPRILVGMDTRISGDMLESALSAGICSVGAEVVLVGVVPTPAIAYLVKKYSMDAGVMISASHNPMEYNGIKFFNKDGYKLKDELEENIESILEGGMNEVPVPVGNAVGSKSYLEDGLEDYIEFLSKSTDIKLEGLKVALDCANGAAYEVAPLTLFNLGADVCVIHHEPNGLNINDNCGSTHMEDLKKFVKENNADIGFAFDGDADRCLAVDENGEILDGDKILSICGIDMKKKRKLNNDTIVGTVMSNLGFSIMGKENGINIEQADVGDRYVLEKMINGGYNLGGEQSGHIIFLDYNTTGDGVLTAVKLLSVLKDSGKKASELGNAMEVMPQVLVNAKVDNLKKNKYMDYPEIQSAIKAVEDKFSSDGRVLIRTSGTEPLVRVMIEGKDKELIHCEANKLAEIIEKILQ